MLLAQSQEMVWPGYAVCHTLLGPVQASCFSVQDPSAMLSQSLHWELCATFLQLFEASSASHTDQVWPGWSQEERMHRVQASNLRSLSRFCSHHSSTASRNHGTSTQLDPAAARRSCFAMCKHQVLLTQSCPPTTSCYALPCLCSCHGASSTCWMTW